MTNKVKTVLNPRLILIDSENAARIGSILSDILDRCGFNTCIDDYTLNTDFVIATDSSYTPEAEALIPDTIYFDKTMPQQQDGFRHRITSYENALEQFGSESGNVVTYSAENYDAAITCRHQQSKDGILTFDLVGKGILSRVSVTAGKYTVEEILACTAILLAAGLPLAAVLEHFDQ